MGPSLILVCGVSVPEQSPRNPWFGLRERVLRAPWTEGCQSTPRGSLKLHLVICGLKPPAIRIAPGFEANSAIRIQNWGEPLNHTVSASANSLAGFLCWQAEYE